MPCFCCKPKFPYWLTDDQEMCEIQATLWTIRSARVKLPEYNWWSRKNNKWYLIAAIDVTNKPHALSEWQMEVTNERYGGTILHIFLTLISSVLNFLILVDLVGDDLAHQQTLLPSTLNKFETNNPLANEGCAASRQRVYSFYGQEREC